MSGVFISYRREDSAYAAGRLYDRLVGHFSKDRVFRDIDTISPGADFAALIDARISLADALVAVIGRDWLNVRDSEGKRRIDDPGDWVRLEIVTALKRGVMVVPVLIEGAPMPRTADLPSDLQAMARRHAVDLADSRWDYEVGQLLEALDVVVSPGTTQVATVEATPTGRQRRRTRIAASAGLAIALLTVLTVTALAGRSRSGDVAAGQSSTTSAGASTSPSTVTVPSPPDSVVLPTVFNEFAIATANSGPTDLTEGPDGAIWFLQSTANKIGRVTKTGVITEFAVPTANAGLDSIVAGPDGALWFTERTANKIGRITTGGVVTEFATPSTSSNPKGLPNVSAGASSIARGPDGALWFTESNADKIGRITTVGEATDYPLPAIATRHDAPGGITLGPDGAMWFTEALSAKIGRIDVTTHAITEFPLPSMGGIVGLTSIVTGPDKALWFAQTGKIGRMTTTGQLKQYDAPFATTPGGENMAVGGGALWFTENRANRVARITTDGQITEFDIPTSDAGIAGLVVDSAGDIWFSEKSANKIGRLRAA